MRSITPLFVIVLLISLLAGDVYSQQVNFPVLKFKAKGDSYAFYDSPIVKTLKFKIENLTPEYKLAWEKIVEKSDLVEKINFFNYENGIQNGEFVFKKEINILTFRSFLEESHIEYFYFKDKKVLTKTIIPVSEAQENASKFKFKEVIFQKEYNDSSRIEYYDFQVYFLGTKIQLMQSGNYVKYLFDGYVAKYTDLLDKAVAKRELFLNENNN